MVRVGWFFAALLSVTLCSCTGSGPVSNPIDNSAAILADNQAGFALTVDPACLLTGTKAAAFTLAVDRRVEETVVSINADDARSLKALYCTLQFDPKQYTPAEALPAFEPDGQLYLDVTPERGVLEYGQILRDALAATGFSGDGTLATVTFTHASQPPVADRSVSAPPVKAAARAELMLESLDTLLWNYTNPGDYNEDGLVGVSDLTPLGVHFNKTQASADWNTARVADGNDDGVITVADITTIGQNFNAFVEGFNVYMSPDQPDAATGPFSADDMIGTIAREDANSNDGEPLWFLFPFIEMIENDYLWIAPYHGDEVGIASNWTNGPLDTVAQLAVADSELEGRGHRVDPYLSYADESLTFTLTDGTAGDVSASEDTVWMVWPEEAGTFTPGTGELALDPAYAGDLKVSASYQGGSCFPYSLTVNRSLSAKTTSNYRDLSKPIAKIVATPSTGYAPLLTTVTAEFSYDWDGDLQTAEWKLNGKDEINVPFEGPFTGHRWMFRTVLEEGEHKFDLKVTDATGLTAEDSTIVYVTALDEYPRVFCKAEPTEGYAPLTVKFFVEGDAGSGEVHDIRVDFNGDGRIDEPDADTNGFEYTYTVPGIYRVWVYATDADGQKGRVGKIIQAFPSWHKNDENPWVEVYSSPLVGYAPLDVDVLVRWWDKDMEHATLDHYGNEITWNPEHRSPTKAKFLYTEEGEYHERFQVKGSSTDSGFYLTTTYVLPSMQTEILPSCTLEATPDEGPAPLTVDYTATWNDNGGPEILWAGTTAYTESRFGVTDRIDKLATNNQYSYSRQYDTPGRYIERLIVINKNFRHIEVWAEVTVTDEYNTAPEITVTATPDRGFAQLDSTINVEFSDPDGDAVSLQFFNPDSGLWEDDSHASPLTYTESFTTPGLYEVKYRVSDEHGARTEGVAAVLVGERHAAPIVEDNIYDLEIEKAADGTPEVLYSKWNGEQTVTVGVPASDPRGQAWEAPVEVTDQGGFYIEMQGDGAADTWEALILDKHQMKLYRMLGEWIPDSGSKSRSTSAVSWGSPQELSGFQNTGCHMSLAVINGAPAMAGYQEEYPSGTPTEQLMYYYSTDDGAGGLNWQLSTIDTAGAPGQFIKLIEGATAPLVVYVANPAPDTHELRFAGGTDAAGSGWSTPVLIDDDGGTRDIGWQPALCLVGGNPLIAWSDHTSGDIYILRADDATGTAWPLTDAHDSIAGYAPRLMAMTDTQFALVWLATDQQTLMMAHGVYDPDGGDFTFGTPFTVYDFTAAEDPRYVNYDLCFTTGEAYPSIAVVDSASNPDQIFYVTFEPPAE